MPLQRQAFCAQQLAVVEKLQPCESGPRPQGKLVSLMMTAGPCCDTPALCTGSEAGCPFLTPTTAWEASMCSRQHGTAGSIFSLSADAPVSLLTGCCMTSATMCSGKHVVAGSVFNILADAPELLFDSLPQGFSNMLRPTYYSSVCV